MKVGIIGQKWLAHEVFNSLIDQRHEVVFAAAPGEGDRLFRAAGERGVPAFAYKADGLSALEAFSVDLLICAHAFIFVPASLRAKAAYAIGYHPSLLPLFKGRRSVDDAISARQNVTGGTVYHLSDDWDAGPVAFQDWCFIHKGETAAGLWRRALAPMGRELLLKAADHLELYGFIPGQEQEAIGEL
jgi:methionyl-tRNA formyltransferase